MEISAKQQDILKNCAAVIEDSAVFRKLFWKWYEEHGRVGGESPRDQIKQLREFLRAIDKVGKEKMPYIISLLYYGRDLAAHNIVLQKPNGDYYVLSVCEQLETEFNKFSEADDPYSVAFVSDPDKLVDWLRTACSIVEETMSIANF